jgi:hypothetical protein
MHIQHGLVIYVASMFMNITRISEEGVIVEMTNSHSTLYNMPNVEVTTSMLIKFR